jgi:Zn-dependent protease with chaperone function
MTIVAQSRTAKERVYGGLLILFGVLGWALVGAFLVFASDSGNEKLVELISIDLFYVFIFVVFIWISGLVYRAYSYGNMILLGRDQFPTLHAMVEEGAAKLGLKTPPAIFLYNSNGVFNAFARRILGGRYVYLTSALVEAEDDAQIRFVIGHELGHHAAGHLNPWLNFIKAPGRIVPFLYPAYSRARETTCDAVGYHLSLDAKAARSSLAMLGCGCRRLNTGLNCEAFERQEQQVPAIFGFLTEIFRSHPRLTRRVAYIARLVEKNGSINFKN